MFWFGCLCVICDASADDLCPCPRPRPCPQASRIWSTSTCLAIVCKVRCIKVCGMCLPCPALLCPALSCIGGMATVYNSVWSQNQLPRMQILTSAPLLSKPQLARHRLHFSTTHTPTTPQGMLLNLVHLKYCNLSDNNLSGKLPECFKLMTQLKTLDLRRNEFEGELPSSLSKLTSLETLKLAKNLFTGHVQEWFSLLAALVDLDLSGMYACVCVCVRVYVCARQSAHGGRMYF